MRNTTSRAGPAGFTLIETLLAVIIVGILGLIGLPRMQRALLKSNLRSARTTLITLYQQARGAALESRRSVTLTVTGNVAVAVAGPRLSGAGDVDTIGSPIDFGTQYGATVTSEPAAPLRIDPRGYGTSASTTIFLTNSTISATDSVVVGAFGVVIK